ncbi:MAG TPA: CopD family protein [Gemmatimonadaceae bacterium]
MYLSAMLVIGSCAFILLIATRVVHLARAGTDVELPPVVPGTRLLARWAAVVLALAMLARLFAQTYMVGEGDLTMMTPLLAKTFWGWGWLVGALSTLVVVGVLFVGRGKRAVWRVTAAGMIGIALSFSLTGHAASESKPILFVMLDSIHVMAAGGWLGTLLVVTTVGLRSVLTLSAERRGQAASELINAFSTFALLCASTLVITGFVAGWSHLHTLSALWKTAYGQALFRKLVVIGMMALVGAFNWRVIRPRLANADTIPLLRKSAAVELTFGLVVVILTAILVGTSPPDSEDAMPGMGMHSRSPISLTSFQIPT